MEGLSAGDILALTKNSDSGLGGSGGASWIILLFIFLLGIGGNGLGGRNNADAAIAANYATQADIQRGFDTNSIINKLDANANGLSSLGFTLQNSINTGFSALASQYAQCCCETNRNIDSIRYESAKNTCDIINSANANTQRILDRLCHDENQALRDKIFTMSQESQTALILNSITNNCG